MSKLIFRYGAMGSSKTANALMVRFNYQERGMKAVMLKPLIENRSGEGIHSRIGLSAEAEVAEEFLKDGNLEGVQAIIVDEAQFLDPCWIDILARIVDTEDIPVICYGLRTDFTGHLFPGSRRLMELADLIEEVPTVCWCGRKAHFNARIKDGEVIRAGEIIQQGGNEMYTSLCRKHYTLGMIGIRKKKGR